jgi:(S)-3,5-dihydroxyphenylglycine transaminase
MIKELNTINPLLKSLGEDVMGFLNEIQSKYPKAISLASGRPDEDYFDLQDFPEYFNLYVETMALFEKKARKDILNNLGQYNLTKGIINGSISKYLKNDEGIIADPNSILMTVGTQEGLAITVMTLCDRENDIILVEDPTYVGITHFSIIAGYKIDSVPVDLSGISLDILERKISSYNSLGKKVKIVYVIPDYQNPTGNSMPLENRLQLLELANQHDFFIVEDNAYGEFIYSGEKCRSIKAFDVNKKVIYLRSFSKTLFPSLRLGAMVADQNIQDGECQVPLSDLMAKTKGYITVNTSSINQAIFGGILIKNKFSLKHLNKGKVDNMKKKRNQMLFSLEKYLNEITAPWAVGISWNKPDGGFFITIQVPFNVDKNDVTFCAENHYVIFTPMSFFYLGKGGNNSIRLAFSNIPFEKIEPAIKNLAMYFKNKISNNFLTN